MIRVADARLSFIVAPGEIVALTGPNGAGKSTLASFVCAGRVGAAGRISVDGIDPSLSEEARQQVRRLVGMVQQDPADQIVSTVVFDEVAFGPRNLGLPDPEVSECVSRALACVGLEGFENRDTNALSGGEQQRLALAGVLAMRPRYLVLDEVTAMLDGRARASLRRLFRRFAAEEGVGILTITHDPVELDEADRVVVLGDETAPRCQTSESASSRSLRSGATHGPLELKHITHRYEGASAPAIEGISLTAAPGEVLLLTGPSGAGKSTLAAIVAGLLEPTVGAATLAGQPVRPGMVGMAFQRPEGQLFLDTVYDELAYGPRNLGLAEEEVDRRVRAAAARVGLTDDLLPRYPLELSGGQQRRVGLASVLSLGAGAYVLDEPTAGLDAAGREALRALVLGLSADGIPVIVISHDVDEWEAVADKRVSLREPAPHPQDKPHQERGGIDARVKLALLLALIVSLLAAPGALPLVLGTLALGACLRAARVDLWGILRQFKPIALILTFTLLANLVACDGSGSVPLAGPVGLDPAGGLTGASAVLRIALTLGFALVLAQTTPPTAICDACVRLLRPFARLGVPVGDAGMALSLALRFMPLVSEEFQRVRTAQRSRGARFDTGPLIQRIRVHNAVLIPLAVGLLRRADRLAYAMAARCYGDGAELVPPRALTGRDAVFLVFGLSACGIMVLAAFALQG